MTLFLEKVPGECPTETVFRRDYRGFTLWVKHEYEGAPWEWLIFEGKDAVTFGDAVTQAGAERELAAAAAEFCPELVQLEPPADGDDEGILRVVGRLVVDQLRRGLDAVEKRIEK